MDASTLVPAMPVWLQSLMPQFRQVSFVWPQLLWLLLLLAILPWLYRRVLARQRAALRHLDRLELSGDFAALAPSALRRASSAKSGARRWSAIGRHGPAVLLWLALAALVVAMARPEAMLVLPTRADTIILVMDVSGSMRATDIKPSRWAAAQVAAKAFVEDQPSQVRVGIVGVAATAALAQSPTTRRDELFDTIDRFQLQGGSALGSGLVIALATLLPEAAIDVERIIFGTSSAPRDAARQQAFDSYKPVAPGSNPAAAIVLVTDGESNTGPELRDATKLAADRGVRIYTVGVGTPEGSTLTLDGWSMRVRLNEEALKNVAAATRGEYFRAGSADDLKRIYRQLAARLTMGSGHVMEVTALCVALGALLATLAVALSVLRFNRVL